MEALSFQPSQSFNLSQRPLQAGEPLLPTSDLETLHPRTESLLSDPLLGDVISPDPSSSLAFDESSLVIAPQFSLEPNLVIEDQLPNPASDPLAAKTIPSPASLSKPFDTLLNDDLASESDNQTLLGVIDTGFDPAHMEVEFSDLTLGRDRVEQDDNPLDSVTVENYHGSALVNLMGATQGNDIGIDGATNDASLWLGKAVGSGQWADSLVEFVDAAKSKGHEQAVVNLSFDLAKVDDLGNVTSRQLLTAKEIVALDYAQRNNVIVVVAAGNEGGDIGALGQASTLFDNVITVGAADGLERAAYSNQGTGLDILAEGGTSDRPLDTGIKGGELYGTSAAAATVSGVVADLWSANPTLNYQQVLDLVKTTATDLHTEGWDGATGAGLINPEQAMAQAQQMNAAPLTDGDRATSLWIPADDDTVTAEADGQFIERPLMAGNSDKKTALLVANSRKLGGADRAVRSRLENLGYTVVVRDDDGVKSSDANGKDLVIISESVLSGKVGRTFTQTKVPVLNMEPFLYDDLNMTGSRKGKDFGVSTKNNSVRMVEGSSNHPLAAGLSNRVNVYGQKGAIGWGNPNDNAIEVASVSNGDRSKATVFGYDQGATMVGGQKAPARRAGLYLMDKSSEGRTLTNQGWRMFDSTVTWLTDSPSSGNPDPVDNGGNPDPVDNGNGSNGGNGGNGDQGGNGGNGGNSNNGDDRALLVTESTKLSGGDRAVKARLESLGYTVTVKDDGAARSSDANGQDLVVISESVDSKQIGQTFTRVNTPVINLEPFLHDDLKLTGNRAGQDFGFQTGQRNISIDNGQHPLAAGFTSTTPVYSRSGSIGWGNPNDNAVEIASLGGDRSKSTVFGYEKGDTLADGSKAAERRVGLFLSARANEGQSLSNQGWKVFDSAVAWATDNENPAAPDPDVNPPDPDRPKPVGDPGDKPGGDPGDKPGGEPGDNPGGEPDDNPGGEPGDNPGGEPGDNPGGEPDDNGDDKDKPDGGDRPFEPAPPSPSPNPSRPPKPSGKANGEFQVIGSKIYDPNGVEFITKGVNKFTFTKGSDQQVDQIKNDWQFNTVRLNYFLEGQSGQQLHSNIKAFSENKVVTIVELHDRTGKYWEGKDLGRLKSWFRDFAERYKDNPYVWFNIANEPGGSKSVQQIDKWLTQHQEVIKVIRDEVGASNPIVVDAHFWGQDVGEWNSDPVKESKSSILSYGDKIKRFDGKSYDNIIFSVHLYDQWNFGESKMANYFDRIEDKDHAVIVGEYGQINTSYSTQKATTAMFNVTRPREIGRIAWVWSARDSNDLTTTKNGGGEHINDDDNPTNLSWLGQRVWKDNRRQEDLERL